MVSNKTKGVTHLHKWMQKSTRVNPYRVMMVVENDVGFKEVDVLMKTTLIVHFMGKYIKGDSLKWWLLGERTLIYLYFSRDDVWLNMF